jgi:hypothetical protein
MKGLWFACDPDLFLPLEVVTQKLAFLGTSGGGKTYGASKLAELMLEASAQVVILDPVGVWYGLRVGAGGKGAGLQIPVLGGLHGDIPLEAGAGELVANTVVETGTSVVLDVSMFRKHQRREFATAFAEQLFHRKKGSPSALHVFIEEAQTFLPQFDRGGESARMLGAFEDLTKIGRNFGIGHTLISQRPQAVNKDALNQVGTLFVFRTIAKQERRAIQDWIVEHEVEARIDELPKMPTGEAFVYSPSWLKLFRRVRILGKRTYDASATPTVGASARAVRLAAVDLVQLQAAMKSSVERAAADDPKKLRAQVGQLTRDLHAAQTARETAAAQKPVEVGIRARDLRKLETAIARAETLARHCLAEHLRTVLAGRAGSAGVVPGSARPRLALRPPFAPLSGGRAMPPIGDTKAVSPGGTRTVPSVARPSPASKNGQGGNALTKGERLMLTALAQYAPRPIPAARAALLSGYSLRSSTFRNILSQIRVAGFAAGDRAGLAITEAGLEALGEYSPLPEGPDLQEYWLRHVGEASAPGRVLRVLIENYASQIPRDVVAESAGQSPASSTYRNALSTLRTLGLIEGRGALRASPDLFHGSGKIAELGWKP